MSFWWGLFVLAFFVALGSIVTSTMDTEKRRRLNPPEGRE